MDEQTWMAERFETHRRRLEEVAQRILGSGGEAGDAVQEAWLRFSRSDSRSVDNLGGWLTTVVARICLDMLRARKSRREDPDGNAVSTAERHLPPAESGAGRTHRRRRRGCTDGRPGPTRARRAGGLRAPRPLRRPVRRHRPHRRPLPGRGPAARQPRPPPRPGRREERRPARRRSTAGGRVPSGVTSGQTWSDCWPSSIRRWCSARTPPRRSWEWLPRFVGREAVAAVFRGRAQAATTVLIDGIIGIRVAPAGQLLLVLRPEIVDGRIVAVEAVADSGRLADLTIDELPARRSGLRSRPSPASDLERLLRRAEQHGRHQREARHAEKVIAALPQRIRHRGTDIQRGEQRTDPVGELEQRDRDAEQRAARDQAGREQVAGAELVVVRGPGFRPLGDRPGPSPRPREDGERRRQRQVGADRERQRARRRTARRSPPANDADQHELPVEVVRRAAP